MGIDGVFEDIETFNFKYYRDKSTLSEAVKFIEAGLILPILNKQVGENDYGSSKIEIWIQELGSGYEYRNSQVQSTGQEVTASNVYPYFYYGENWFSTNENSPIYKNPSITQALQNYSNGVIELFYFNNAELIYVNPYDGSKKDELKWGDVVGGEFEDIVKFKGNLYTGNNVPLRTDVPDGYNKLTHSNQPIDIPWVINLSADQLKEKQEDPIPGTLDKGSRVVDAYVNVDPDYAKQKQNALYEPVSETLGEQMNFNGLPVLVEICTFCNFMTLQLAGLHEAILLRILKADNFALYKNDIERFSRNAEAKYTTFKFVYNTQAKGKQLSSKESELMQQLIEKLDGQAPPPSMLPGAIAGVAVVTATSASAGWITVAGTLETVMGAGAFGVGGVAAAVMIATGGIVWSVKSYYDNDAMRQKRFENALVKADMEARKPNLLSTMRDKPMMVYYRIMALRNYVRAINNTITTVKARSKSQLI